MPLIAKADADKLIQQTLRRLESLPLDAEGQPTTIGQAARYAISRLLGLADEALRPRVIAELTAEFDRQQTRMEFDYLRQRLPNDDDARFTGAQLNLEVLVELVSSFIYEHHLEVVTRIDKLFQEIDKAANSRKAQDALRKKVRQREVHESHQE